MAELKELDFGYKFFNGEKRGYKIPTLDEVFELVKPLGLIVNVEIKLPSHELVEKTVEIVKRHGMEEKVIYSSFNHYNLKWVKELHPDAYIAPLHHWNLLNAWNYCVDIGAPATANEPEDIQFLLDCGVDVIMTDYPDIAIQLRDRISN